MNLAAPSPATRMALLRTRRRRERVERGADLLRRRREALVRELFEMTVPAIDVRARIEQAAGGAYEALLEALAARGAEGLRPLGWPSRRLEVELEPRQIWGIALAEVTSRPRVRRSLALRETAPGLVDPATLLAAERFEALVDLLLEAASEEIRIRRVADALRRTSRQVRSLEERLQPALEREGRRIEFVLEEREREDRVRLRGLTRNSRRAPARRSDRRMGEIPPSR